MKRREFLALTALLPFVWKFKLTESNKLIYPVIKLDAVNGNNRVYPLHVIENSVKNFQETLGELVEYSDASCDYSIIHFKNVSHQVKKLFIENDYLMAEIEILNTPSGMILKKELSNVCFRPRGTGNGSTDQNGILTIGENYKLITIDAVSSKTAAKLDKNSS